TSRGSTLSPLSSTIGQQYVDHCSFIQIDVCLSKPLVPKQVPEELALKISEYSGARPKLKKITIVGSDKSTEQYKRVIHEIISFLQQEFRMWSISQVNCASVKQSSERARDFLEDLSASEMYETLKEKLQEPILQVIKEKCLKISTLLEPDHLSELYVDLVQQMHQVLQQDIFPQSSQVYVDSEKLLQFAQEAVTVGAYRVAARYHQQRIAETHDHPDSWIDYGVFCLLQNQIDKAEECFKEALAIDQEHMKSLLLSGMLCVIRENYKLAEIILLYVTTAHEDEILPWFVLGLYYEVIDENVGAELAFRKAKDCYRNEQDSKTKGSECTKNSETVFLYCVPWLLDSCMILFAERTLARQLPSLTKEEYCLYYIYMAQLLCLKGNYTDALKNVDHSLNIQFQNLDTWVWKGHVLYIKKDYTEAQQWYERVVYCGHHLNNQHSVLVRLGDIYIKTKQLYSCSMSLCELAWMYQIYALYDLGHSCLLCSML
ncbi:cilia- and flagella-associated protein 70-like, partial [Limulus polyphemus]|uniref:Cilia- and flagella-associated protein 70-like n=1 Tax=Limulus polyphemus TaxID=6850 RepID=A0ABM1TIX6_LIMPO